MLHLSRSPRCLLASTRDAALQSGALSLALSLIFRSDGAALAVVLSAAIALRELLLRCFCDDQDAVQLQLEGLTFLAG